MREVLETVTIPLSTLKQWHTLADDTFDDLHCGVECGVNGEGYDRARKTAGELLKEIKEVLK